MCSIEDILLDSDLEEEEDKSSKASRQAVRKGGQRQNWIKEGAEDITDLMDTSAAKKVMGENVLLLECFRSGGRRLKRNV